MKIYSYGEDAYTLWAIQNKLSDILKDVGDFTDEEGCIVFFRPSFGRRGGEASPQFGEFDWIVLSGTAVYLGESKWSGTKTKQRKEILLKDVQKTRHYIMQAYIKEWLEAGIEDWQTFYKNKGGFISYVNELKEIKQRKLAPAESLLEKNLSFFLEKVKTHFGAKKPEIRHVLLHLYSVDPDKMPKKVKSEEKRIDGFTLVEVNCFQGMDKHSDYIKIETI